MPTYKYKCKDCGYYFEVAMSFKPSFIACPKCYNTNTKLTTEKRKTLSAPEPAPSPTNLESAWGKVILRYRLYFDRHDGDKRKITLGVIKMMEDRDQYGFEKYGMHITAFNGRNSLVDLIQEKLDSLVYAQNCIDEGIDGDNRIQFQMNNTLFDLEELYELLVKQYPEKALV